MKNSASPVSGGEFFAIDSRHWAKVSDLGMNEAVAYLVLARGTGPDQRTTRWAAEAAHRYSGMMWTRAKTAIDNLIQIGIVKHGKEHTKEKPRYELMPYEKGAAAINDHCMWLPNTIVTGTASGETSPVARLRASGDRWALRLFVDLYAVQNLREDGGISPSIIREPYERRYVGERGIYSVWGFKRGTQSLSWAGPLAVHKQRPKDGEELPAWASVLLLQKMGLLSFIPHMMENNSKDAQIIHPYGIGGNDEEVIETEMGEAADRAARQLLPEWGDRKAEEEDLDWLCPVPRTLPSVQMVGVARLRYRPHTRRSAAWIANLRESGKAILEHYEKIGAGEHSDLLQVRSA